MFCSNCGKSDQKENSYCRQCGEFLMDSTNNLSLLLKVFGINTTEKQVTANLVISSLGFLLTLALLGFLMGYFRAGEDKIPPVKTPTVIYFVYAFLSFISVWQLFSLIFALTIKNKFKGRDARTKQEEISGFDKNNELSAKTQEILPTAKINSSIKPKIVENTTKILNKKPTS